MYITEYRGVEQLVARRAHNPKVTGSSPVPATNVYYCFRLKDVKRLYAGVAQSVERILGKDKATGSIPVTSSIYSAGLIVDMQNGKVAKKIWRCSSAG